MTNKNLPGCRRPERESLQIMIMRTASTLRYLKLPFTVLFSFILGSMFTINITPIDKTCVIENTDKEYNIMRNSKLKNPELVIVVLSAPKNLEKRDVARETWLKLYRRNHEEHHHEQFKIKHYFVVGSLGLSEARLDELNSEQLRHNDILLVPIRDSYRNLTAKVKRTFEWLDEQIDYGLGFKHVFKCDDDSFVNLKPLISELIMIESLYLGSDLQIALQLVSEKDSDVLSMNVQINDKFSRKNELNLYWGYFSGTARIKTKGKWKENDWIVSERYVPYTLGGGYLLSKDLVRFIARNSHNLRSFSSEDVSVGLWLAPVNNILRIHDTRFDTEWASRGCQNTHLVRHNVSPSEMKLMFNNLVAKKELCARETLKRGHYLYDWSVSPSQCCKPAKDSVIIMAR